MADTDSKSNLPALTRQVTELVLAGSLGHAEQAFSDAADQYGDLAAQFARLISELRMYFSHFFLSKYKTWRCGTS